MSKRGSSGSLQRLNRAASNAAIATANAAGKTVAAVQKKKEMVLTRPKKGVGVITDEDALEMQRACGYGGPHIPPRIEKVWYISFTRVAETGAATFRSGLQRANAVPNVGLRMRLYRRLILV